jgi:isoaspartyl peptidase/L-asparaginase-like protein (Ntn-hydrolase superfamily)
MRFVLVKSPRAKQHGARKFQSNRNQKMSMSRRKFVGRTAAGLLGAAALSSGRRAMAAENAGGRPLIVSTWPFGKASNDAAMRILLGGGAILDAVEQGIWVTESDTTNKSVGLGGGPNAAGVVQLDSCIMYGPGHKAGSVAAIEGIKHPISAARRVMEKTPHVMLVGEGARMFALEEGLESVEVNAREHYEAWQKQRAALKKDASAKKPDNHDTIAMLVLAADGTIAGGCSTSGLAGKLPGRVGDSPIIGGGLYVDNEVGAAGATGLGENVMRYCASFMIVEFMRQGLNPQEACQKMAERIAGMDPKGLDVSVNFVALDKSGLYGAAGTDKDFKYSVTTKTDSRVLPNPVYGKLKPATGK